MEQEGIYIMIVEWQPMNREAIEESIPPQPAKQYMPEWYKRMPPFYTGNRPSFNSDAHQANSTEKLCMPFFDTFVTGYIQETWTDILVENDGAGGIKIHQASPRLALFGIREDRPHKHFPEGYLNLHTHWFTQWEPKTPKGWSSLYMHPMNHWDLPFYTMNGVLDTDRWWIGGGLPFFLKENFEGIIPKGTPMYQVVFFKRENWKSKYADFDEKEFRKLDTKVRSYMHSGFKRNIWVKKSYE
jgi:hypothetical protein